MPTIPKRVTLTNSSVEVLNVIREHASINYANYVPFAQPEDAAESIRQIGAVIMDNPQLQNEFLSTLINRIGLVLIKSISFRNPWAIFKRGFLGFGETVEEIWVDIAKPHEYSAEVAEEEVFKREIPDVRSAFHILNYQKFYKRTIQRSQLEMAFLSENGVTDLANRIIDSMYKGMEYDEFLTMRYLLARRILDNHFYYIPSDGATTEEDAKKTLAHLREVNNLMVFPSKEYNIAHVLNSSSIADQQCIISAEFESHVDVYALASAFNLNYADFMTKRILTPHFYFTPTEIERLDELFEFDKTYKTITSADNEILAGVHAIVVDRDYFMIFDKLLEFGEIHNVQGLYWNYDLHTWKLFSVSPFHNAVCLIDKNLYSGVIDISNYSASLYDMTTGEAIANTDIIEEGKKYGIAVTATDITAMPQNLAIKSVTADDSGVIATLSDNNSAITFTGLDALNENDDVIIHISVYGSNDIITVVVGVAP